MKRGMRKLFSAALLLFLGSLPLQAGNDPLTYVSIDKFSLMENRIAAPDVQFMAYQDQVGESKTIADYKGQVILVNFWATWCPPCVKEMPYLDNLQAELGEEGLVVMPISLDRGGIRMIDPFYEEKGLAHIGRYWDKGGKLAQTLGVTGLPVTFLIDRQGQIIGGMKGDYKWDSPQAIEFIRAYLAEQDPATTQQSRLP